MGPPGAGKGTQATFLRDRYHLQSLSPGDILRKEVKDGTELGKQAKGYMDTGALVPDELILKIVGSQMDQLKPGEGFLLDGFPRSEEQARLLDGSTAANERAVNRGLPRRPDPSLAGHKSQRPSGHARRAAPLVLKTGRARVVLPQRLEGVGSARLGQLPSRQIMGGRG